MRHRLSRRFIVAGALSVLATLTCGAWSIYAFGRLSHVVDRTLHDSQREIDLASELSGLLEREDDAMLLAIARPADASRAGLVAQRPELDRAFALLRGLLVDPIEQGVAHRIERHVAAYRQAVDQTLQLRDPTEALVRYHRDVNPRLREAVADCGQIRESNFRAMKAAGVGARDEARRGIGIIGLVLGLAVAMSIAVALSLARTIVGPIRAITSSIEALRGGEFGRRVRVDRGDELGVLADGFNRMAAALEEFRTSNLGEVLRAKSVLETTLEALPDGVLVLNPDGDIETMNRVARRILGDAASLDDTVLQTPLRAEIAAARSGLDQTVRRSDLRRALPVDVDGVRRMVLPIAAPIGNGPAASVVMVLYDVTDLVHLDELRGEVIAVASHELRTPLTTIRMNLMMLCEQAVPAAAGHREMLENAVMGCDELTAMTERLLDMARIEAGQLRLARELIDVGDVVENAVSQARPRAAGAEVEIVVERGAARLPARVDVARLQVAIANVLGNAIKYSPRGGIITVALADEPAAVRVAIVDRGPGVPPGLRERVFEKFFRIEHLDPDRDHGVRGVGLGLYLTRQIVEAHGGSVVLEAATGAPGARVTMTIPRGG